MRRSGYIAARLAGAILAPGVAFVAQAHESFLDCYDNGDDTITCQAGYSDGDQPAEADRILIKDRSGKTLLSGQFDEQGSFSFSRPEQEDFMIIFVGSTVGHTNRVDAGDLVIREP